MPRFLRYTHRCDVDTENTAQLDKLPGPPATAFKSIDTFSSDKATVGMLEAACPAPRTLGLKVS